LFAATLIAVWGIVGLNVGKMEQWPIGNNVVVEQGKLE
jgi:hypothetical protein